jgi:general secretion pathway protein L
MNTSTNIYKEALARLKKQLLASRFLRWWLGELASMVPVWMRAASVTAESFLLVPLEQVSAQYSLPENGNQRDLALTLPASRVLRKILKLPLATEENLRQVLEFQVEQHTPFSPSQVYFGFWVTGRDFENGQLTIEFVATPRDGVDAAIKTLSGLGSSVQAVFAVEMLAAANLVNLLPAGLGKKPSLLKHGLNPWLAAFVGLLALSSMAMPLVIKREAVVQMLPWVEKSKAAAETVDSMRRELETRVEQHNYLLHKRQALPTVVQSLEELTRILPDGTWVQSIDIRDKEVQIQGETNASVKLIGLFEQSGMFRDASFRSPLTKVNSSSNERYHLALQVRPEVAPVAAPASVVAQQVDSIPAAAATPVLASSAPALKASENNITLRNDGSKP